MPPKMKVYSIEDALKEVRKVFPNATKQGSTFDWGFYVDGKLVAEAVCNRRVKRDEWTLTICRETN